MNLSELNGTTMKALSVIGTAAIAYLVFVALAWFGNTVLGVTMSQSWEAITTMLVVLFGGFAGTKYAQGHNINKKE